MSTTHRIAILVLALEMAACRSAPPPPPPAPVPLAAQRAWGSAQSTRRASEGPAARAERWELLSASIDAAPDWAPPRRSLDDERLRYLLGPEALAEHLTSLGADPGDALASYLAGRLEGEAGRARFERAVRARPSFAWGHHGLAWSERSRLRLASARELETRALQLARGGVEQAHFRRALSLLHAEGEYEDEARSLLEQGLELEGLARSELLDLALALVEQECGAEDDAVAERGYQRGLALIARHALDRAELGRMLLAVFAGGGVRTPTEVARDLRIALALTVSQHPAAREFGANLRQEGDGPARSSQPAWERERHAAFGAGRAHEAMQAWLADQPSVVLREDGSPRREALRLLVSTCAAHATGAVDDAAVGRALFDAGWYAEALEWARWVSATRAEPAFVYEFEAASMRSSLDEVARWLRALDEGRSLPVVGIGPLAELSSEGSEALRAEDLRTILRALERLFARSEGEADEAGLGLVDSPMISFGIAGAVVHPGPTYSAADEAAGEGARGAEVPGLARLFAGLGRFAIFGRALGQAPDATILRVVAASEESGEHLGVPWSGMVVHGEAPDLSSRPARLGGAIAGAALHRGYWLDLDVLRAERDAWFALQTRMLVDEPELTARALSSRGVLRSGPATPAGARDDGAGLLPLLGEGQRVRLAVLSERARSGADPSAPLVRLDEVLEVAAIHEQGHLCDRGRFLPLREHLPRAVLFAIGAGLSGESIVRRLEYRAQLIALCDAPDPRLPLAVTLLAAEGSSGPTAHGDAYRELAVDLLQELARGIERDPSAYSELDPAYHLTHQLHHLRPESVRRLALALALAEGLDA